MSAAGVGSAARATVLGILVLATACVAIDAAAHETFCCGAAWVLAAADGLAGPARSVVTALLWLAGAAGLVALAAAFLEAREERGAWAGVPLAIAGGVPLALFLIYFNHPMPGGRVWFFGLLGALWLVQALTQMKTHPGRRNLRFLLQWGCGMAIAVLAGAIVYRVETQSLVWEPGQDWQHYDHSFGFGVLVAMVTLAAMWALSEGLLAWLPAQVSGRAMAEGAGEF